MLLNQRRFLRQRDRYLLSFFCIIFPITVSSTNAFTVAIGSDGACVDRKIVFSNSTGSTLCTSLSNLALLNHNQKKKPSHSLYEEAVLLSL